MWAILAWFSLVAGCTGRADLRLAAAATPGSSGIAGTVLGSDGTPATGAMVYAYRSTKSGLRGPADFAAEVEADGRYFLDLVEGRYHLVARQRLGGGEAGPPRAGDAWAVFPRNPVVVQADRTGRADFRLQGVRQPQLLKEGSLASGETGFRGRLVDAAGQPLAGAFVLAYRNDDFRRRPDFTSAPSDGDGRFTLFVPQGGHFCLAARTRTRGQPSHGELYAQLGIGEEACRTVSAGELLEVGEFRLEPFHGH